MAAINSINKQNINQSVFYCIYFILKLQKQASVEVTGFKCYLLTGSETKDKLDSTPVFQCMHVNNFSQYSDFHTLKNKMPISLKDIFIFALALCFKLNVTCVCLPSPSQSLLKEHWSWVSLVLSSCLVRKPQWVRMVSKYLKTKQCSWEIMSEEQQQQQQQ